MQKNKIRKGIKTGNFCFFFFQRLNRDLPSGKPSWDLVVFAQDKDGRGPIAHASLHVTVKDINDNQPFFLEVF